MTDKMREEFEAAWAAIKSDDEGAPGSRPTRSQVNPDGYAGGAADFAWRWWKRSRESLAIELPPAPPAPEEPEEAFDDSHMDGYNAAVRMRSACERSIKAAGLKVKP